MSDCNGELTVYYELFFVGWTCRLRDIIALERASRERLRVNVLLQIRNYFL